MKILLLGNFAPDAQESMLRFGETLATGLRRRGVEVEYLQPQPVLSGRRAGPSGAGKWLGYADKFLVFPNKLKAAALGADLVHIVDHSNAPYLKHIAGCPHLLTCNDLLAIRAARGEFPEYRPRFSGRILQKMILSGIRKARRVTCISQATREDLLRIAGLPMESVSVTYMGLNGTFRPVPNEAGGSEREPYILHVGSDAWYKNRGGVLAAYRLLRSELGAIAPRLVMVGPPVASDEEGVECLQNVSNEDLQRLYSRALLLLFPSHHEGFGWPIIEAQACGCPVITTGHAPMTEVGGDAAIYLEDPHDVPAMVREVRRVLEMPAVQRQELCDRGFRNARRFDTERMLDQYLGIYEELLGR